MIAEPEVSYRVLIVDDSALFREALAQVLDRDPQIVVVGRAKNGREAVELTARLRPQVIIMDLHMPVMDGLEAVERIMARTPTPILVFTEDPSAGQRTFDFEALRRGALEVMAKPESWDLGAERQAQICRQVKLAAGVTVLRHVWGGRLPALEETGSFGGTALASSRPRGRGARPAPGPRLVATPVSVGVAPAVVGVAASTGGPAALAQILEALPADFPLALVVVQHIAPGFCEGLARWLDEVSPLSVATAQPGAALLPGQVLLAPEGAHTVVDPRRAIARLEGEPVDGHRPSATVLLESIARAYGPRAVGLVLTGMGCDGAAGLLEMRRRGAVTLVQDEASCVVTGMPRAALSRGAALYEVELSRIPAELCSLARGVMAASHGRILQR